MRRVIHCELMRGQYAQCAAILLLAATVVFGALRRRNWNPTPLRQAVTAGALFTILSLLVLARDVRTWTIGPGAGTASHSGKPNVLLITMDTVRADHLSVYGYPTDTTPNLREFSRSATVYTRAVAASDYTLPAHASIFTGLYPDWHGAIFLPTV